MDDSPTIIIRENHLTPAAVDVLAERERQIEKELFTTSHDDLHMVGQLLLAASSYVDATFLGDKRVPDKWPWERSWWKPTTPRRNLVKAAALLLAEIERIDRLTAGMTNKKAD